MPLPVAHSLVAASAAAAAVDRNSERLWPLLLVGAFLGVCPDFDYLLNWLRIAWGGWHHGFTHSIVFALFIGALTARVYGWSVLRFIAFSAAVASHSLLDYLMTESRGVALWWPFTDRRYKFRGPNPIDYTWSSTSFWDAAVDILRISLMELIIFAPLLLLVIFVKRYSNRANSSEPSAT